MHVPCTGCAKTLSVPDHLAGRRIKCPRCQQVLQVPASTAVTAAPASMPVPSRPPLLPVPANRAAAPLTRDAVREGAPPVPAQGSCPECSGILAAGASECPHCGAYWDQPAAPTSRSARRSTRKGRCYVFIDRDEVDLTRALVKRLEKLNDTEQLNLRIVEEEMSPEDIGPDDVLITGRVKNYDYGSQFMRYMLTFITLLGPGSCQLEVVAQVKAPGAKKHRINAKARQGIGIFGGTGPGLMKQNVKIVGNKIATGAAKYLTGMRFLNAQAYSLGFWSLGLGLAALIPCLGLPLGLIALVLGLIAFLTISRRELPRGKGVALTGMILGSCGIFISLGMFLLMALSRR